MILTPEEQALLGARKRMLAAGEALDAAYAALRSAIATGHPDEAVRAVVEGCKGLAGPAADFDDACRAYDAAFRAAYDRSKP